MVFTTAPVRRRSTARPVTRDTGIDFVRALCVVVVVLLHGLMVGVTVGPGGAVFANAAEGTAWIVPMTWVFQIMPVFFAIGGFAGASAYRAMRTSGGTARDFVAARVHRLLMPAVFSIAAAGIGLAALAAFGVPEEVVRIAGFHFSQPLWFLGVFLLSQALLPALQAAHDRAPGLSILALAAAAVAVDVVRTSTGVDAVGFLNLAFVWLALQQLGFFLADGRIDALRPRTRVTVMIGAVAVLAVLVAAGVFSPDLLENLNPPTTTLLLLGVAQTMALSLLRGRLRVFSARPGVAAFIRFVTARTMTIYLWHMPVLLALAGLTALGAMAVGMPLPAPSTAAWWLTRPLWIAAVFAAVTLVAVALAAPERRRIPASTPSPARAALAVLIGVAAVVLLLAGGTTTLTALVAAAAMVGALALSRQRATRSESVRARIVDPATAAGIVTIAPSGTRKHS